ncbi:DUF6975 family protein [Sphingomonas quercus]|uniref:Uncharacterized protein n=1 Tax=Sphingomonas quercus TaxID=2842451 RepID=A0ABS6BE16_9SPHN|nr:hypothetical protein [Sphingomonas quercus]MBU3076399.1 hypothetical protein [Sphingomonas quercus]
MIATNFLPLNHGQVAETVSALVIAEGTASHGYCASRSLAQGPDASRNIADALHYLCVLYGRQPDMIDLASLRHPATQAGHFLAEAADAFAAERLYLAQLAVAAGPQPSTPGQADSQGAVLGHNHALAMLARSDRHGTAFGAAAALLVDWHEVRALLDLAAHRLGVDVPACLLPVPAETLAIAALLAETPAVERAIAFGAQQFLFQQRGMWSLLEAREIARRNS